MIHAILTSPEFYTFVFALGTYLVGRFTPSLSISQQIWINKIGKSNIVKIMKEATELSSATDNIKRAFVTGELQQLAIDKLGAKIPDAICNLIVEFLWNKYKKAIKG
jgi:hypothetical protein